MSVFSSFRLSVHHHNHQPSHHIQLFISWLSWLSACCVGNAHIYTLFNCAYLDIGKEKKKKREKNKFRSRPSIEDIDYNTLFQVKDTQDSSITSTFTPFLNTHFGTETKEIGKDYINTSQQNKGTQKNTTHKQGKGNETFRYSHDGKGPRHAMNKQRIGNHSKNTPVNTKTQNTNWTFLGVIQGKIFKRSTSSKNY